ncbi:MAG: imidazole glycerol phosphate synthase cyclase subunit [Nanoarchaeota archaeon]
MLKKRIVACLNIKNGIVVQSLSFNKYLPIGKPAIAIEFLNSWGIDEIILLDMDATPQKRKPNFELINLLSKKCFVPLTVGGGITTVEDVKQLVQSGADKVSINTAAVTNPVLISEASKIFGNQCIAVSIDAKKINRSDGISSYEVFLNSGKQATGLDPIELAKKVESLGAGEILINSIDKDGSKEGYDLELIKAVSNAVSIPVIACGGVGCPQHLLEGIALGKASAVAAGNFFHFTEHSPIVAKSYLRRKGINVRLDTYANYLWSEFDKLGRIAKYSEGHLSEIRFEYFPKETI